MRKVFIDCNERIPCNPCEFTCKFGAILIGPNLTELPQTNSDLCIGCGACVAACPGQACFLIDENVDDGYSTIDFPYEFFPIPVVGEFVTACDNEGIDVCSGQVEYISANASYSLTKVIRIRVPSKYVRLIRGIKRKLRESDII